MFVEVFAEHVAAASRVWAARCHAPRARPNNQAHQQCTSCERERYRLEERDEPDERIDDHCQIWWAQREQRVDCCTKARALSAPRVPATKNTTGVHRWRSGCQGLWGRYRSIERAKAYKLAVRLYGSYRHANRTHTPSAQTHSP
jgi:hypothetical protein